MAQHISNTNYDLLFKVIGKLAHIYDQTNAQQATTFTSTSYLLEQVADQSIWELDTIFASSTYNMNSTVTSGNLSTLAKTMATNYLLSKTVYAYFSVAPGTTIQSVVLALQAGLIADSKTLTTVSSTGIVNFLLLLNPAATTIPQAASSTASYDDSVYCVDAVLP